MWPFQKKTEIQKIFDKYNSDAKMFLGYLAEYLKISGIDDLTESEKKREFQHLTEVIVNQMGAAFLDRFMVFLKKYSTHIPLIKELTCAERWIEKREKFKEYIRLKRLGEVSDQTNQVSKSSSNPAERYTKDFWNDVRKIYAGLFQITFEEFAPTMAEKGGASFDPKTFKLEINDISDENFYFSMCIAEMALFMRFVFRLTFEQLSSDITTEERIELNDIIDAGIDALFPNKVLEKRDEEYSTLADSTIVIGYSRGELVDSNKNGIESNDFIRRKAAIFFSDLIWLQGEFDRYLSLEECLSIAKQKNVDLHEGLNNAKKAHGAFTFSNLVYDALQKVFTKHIS